MTETTSGIMKYPRKREPGALEIDNVIRDGQNENYAVLEKRENKESQQNGHGVIKVKETRVVR